MANDDANNPGTPSRSEHLPDQSKMKDKKPSLIKRISQKTGVDAPTVMMMFKGSLPPIIGIAIYQADSVASYYGTLGYLIAITSVIGMAIFPRGMFIQSMLLNVLTTCVGASMCLLALYCATQARLHTAAPNASPRAYNSSASAVLAIWLFFNTYWVNCLRAALPQFQFPVIIFSIFSIVGLTNGVQLPNMAAANAFMRRLLVTFLTGFAIATGVHFVILPVTSRLVATKKMSGYLMTMGAMLSTQAKYLESMENFNPDTAKATHLHQAEEHEEKKKKFHRNAHVEPLRLTETAESIKIQELQQKLYELHTKLPGDINFAKREFAVGEIGPRDLGDIWKKMRHLMLPISGLTTVLDVLQRRADSAGWPKDNPSEQEIKTRDRQVENLHQIMQILHEPFGSMSANINAAFKHVLLVLELEKAPKKPVDEESQGGPGSTTFAEAFKRQLDDFYNSKKRTLEQWCQDHDIILPKDFFNTSFVRPDLVAAAHEHARDRDQRQLFFALYIEYLLWRAGHATLELVLHVDKRKAEGAYSKTKLILPGVKTLRKWVRATFGREDITDEDHFVSELDAGASSTLLLGESYSHRKDPEHLPPRNGLEKLGNFIRLIPRALRSDESAYGFRVAVATMSLAIICFLEASQTWFLQNRILWATIMVPLSMTRTAGQSISSFVLRIVGTIIAMLGAYVVYYIVDGQTAGVIVFLWLWIFCAFYIVAKQPKMIIVGILAIITSILIIGYELQTDKIGVQASTSSGQPYYPTYKLAPYRLATVCAGMLVAFIWTIFPYPVSESTELRKDLGASLYLLANLYSVVHETIKSRLRKNDGNEDVKGTRAYHLKKATTQVFTKLITLVTTLKQNSAFSKFQIQVGGRFPREEYEGLIACIQRVLQYTALISYASSTFSTSASDSEWSHDFRELLGSVNATSHKLTSLLALLSSSMSSARPLPPYLEIPQHGRYSKKLEQIDTSILSVVHIAEPEYSAFAVMTICAQCINDDIVKIAKHVRHLVGEIDFSFHAVSSAADSSDDFSIDSLEEKKGSESTSP